MLAFGFGSGLLPKAPGTMGSLAAIPLWLLLIQLPVVFYWLAILIAAVMGVYICGNAAKKMGVHDHSGIVWDEFVGLWIAMAFLPPTFGSIICGFVLFRLFDIVKPWPISWLDKNIHGGLGIMIDDIVAGAFAACIAYYINHLGYL